MSGMNTSRRKSSLSEPLENGKHQYGGEGGSFDALNHWAYRLLMSSTGTARKASVEVGKQNKKRTSHRK